MVTLPSKASVKISSSSIASLKKGKNNTRTLTAKSPGSTTVTVKFYDLNATCKVYVKPLLIYQTERLPGKSVKKSKRYGYEAKDMHSADLSRNEITKLDNFSIQDVITNENQHKNYMMGLCTVFAYRKYKIKKDYRVVETINLKPVAKNMFNHLYNGDITEFRNPKLTKAARTHESTRKYVSGVKEQLNDVLKGDTKETKKYKGNIYSLKYKHTIGKARDNLPLIYNIDYNTKSPNFSTDDDRFNGLTLMIHDFWGNKVEVTSYTYNKKTGKYSGTLRFTLYDHFGLDNKDMEQKLANKKIASSVIGFRSWFVLQRYYAYQKRNGQGRHRPFITYIEFTEKFSGKVKK